MSKNPLLPHRSFWFAVAFSTATSSIGLLGGLGLQATEHRLVHLSDPEMYPARFRRLVTALLAAVPTSIVGISAISLFVANIQGFRLSEALVVHYTIFYAISLIGVVAVTFGVAYAGNQILRAHHINSDDVLVSIMNNVASVLMLLGIAVAAAFYF